MDPWFGVVRLYLSLFPWANATSLIVGSRVSRHFWLCDATIIARRAESSGRFRAELPHDLHLKKRTYIYLKSLLGRVGAENTER